MSITVKQLDQAIANILGQEVADAMTAGRISRPTRHSAAIHRAFVYGGDEEDLHILRQTQIDMDQNGGVYLFSPEI